MTPDELTDIEARRLLAWVFLHTENHGTVEERVDVIRRRALRALTRDHQHRPGQRRPRAVRIDTMIGGGT